MTHGREPARRPAARGRRAASRAAGGAALVCLVTGCVSPTAHREAVAERDDLASRLEAQGRSFEAERDQLYGQLEDARREREKLAAEVEQLRGERDRLAAREQQLAAKATRLDALEPGYEGLVKDLEADLAAARIEIDRVREGLCMSLPAEVLFASGSAELTAEGRRVFAELAGELRDAPYQVRVEGHTDAVPIQGPLAARYPTNWELAGARAARVVRVLEEHGVDPTRLAAVSLGDQHPIASNDTPEGRAENRRIEIRLVPLPGSAPGAAPPGFSEPPRSGDVGAEPAARSTAKPAAHPPAPGSPLPRSE